MKKHILILTGFIIISASNYKLYAESGSVVSSSTAVKEPTDEAQWIEAASNLAPDQRKRVVNFLQATCNTLPDMLEAKDTEARKKIEKVLGEAIAHTERELKKIEAFMQLVESIDGEKEEHFNIPEMVEKSTPSQGQNRVNVSTALQSILIKNSSLIEIKDIANKAVKKVTAPEIKKALKAERTVFMLIKQAYSSATTVLENDSVKIYCDLLKALSEKDEETKDTPSKKSKKKRKKKK